jgi:UPF0271 protein
LRLAADRGTSVGAHPSYDDRAGFGRRETGLPVAAIRPVVQHQLASLEVLAARAGVSIRYVKAHGALYHRTAWEAAAAEVFARAVRDCSAGCWILGPCGSPLAGICQQLGVPFAAEAFLDRGYQPNGHLVPRGAPGALLPDPAAAAARALALVAGKAIAAADGTPLPLIASSLCAHGDGAGALPLLNRVRRALDGAGVAIRSFVT